MQARDYISLHDAEIIGISLDRLQHIVRIDMQQEDGVLRTAELRGVLAFRSEDLKMQNVISRVLLSSEGKLSDESLDHWLGWATSLSDTTSYLSVEQHNEWRKLCISGDLEMVVVIPSAGAQLAALCKRIVLT